MKHGDPADPNGSGGKPDRVRPTDPLPDRFLAQALRSLFETVTFGMYFTDREGHLLLANPPWEEYVGHLPGKAGFREWSGSVVPEDRDTFLEAWERALRGSEKLSVEVRLTTTDHPERRTWFQAVPINIDGVLAGYVGSVMDVTRQRLTEREVHSMSQSLDLIGQVAERLHQFLDFDDVITQAVDVLMQYSHSPSVAVFIMAEDGSCLQLRHARGFTEDTLRRARALPLEGSLTGLAVRRRELITSDSIRSDTRLEPDVRQALLGEGLESVATVPILFQDRTLGAMNLIFTGSRTFSDLERDTLQAIGRTIGLALANAGHLARVEQEVAERRRSEDSLRRRMEELASLNSLGRRISAILPLKRLARIALEEVRDGVNADLAVLYLREGDRLTLQAVIPDRPDFHQPNVEVKKVGECLCGLVPTLQKAVYSRDIHADTRCTLHECKTAGFRSFAALPLRKGEEILGVLGIGSRKERDFRSQEDFLETLATQVSIATHNALLYSQVQQHAAELEQRVADRTTELATKTAELQDANRRLLEADRLKTIFLASMSHELRTPLNSILGFTGIILQGLSGEINVDQRKQLSLVKSSALHLLSLINDLLDVSRVEAGRVQLIPERFNLADLLSEIEAMVNVTARERGLKLHLEVNPDLEMISDRRRIKQIVTNLVGNAVKFTEAGEVAIIAREDDKGAVIQLMVRDTGIGIRPEDLKRLFAPFQQIGQNPIRNQEGTGLGLYLSSRLAKLLHGHIAVHSVYRQGSEFTLTLPRTLETGGSV